MKRGLSIDICAIYIDFIVLEQSNHVMYIGMIDGVEHDVVANFFDFANHF